MKSGLNDNIYIDPLTGMSNFFSFIESDACSIFDECGSVIIFDMVDFTMVNREYGRDIGDMCLKSIGDIICCILSEYNNAHAYRTDGDEFTVILPKLQPKDAEHTAGLIRKKFRDIMDSRGYSNIDVRTLIIGYPCRITTVAQFYQMVFANSISNTQNTACGTAEARWAQQIIESFTRRIKETLSLFNEAYNLALTDDISSLPNHRAAKMYLTNLIAKCKANGGGFSILFIDGDNLKRYNKQSYQSGNKMINGLSSIISGSIRKSDRVFRWLSGDEFLVIFEGTNSKNVIELAERIRTAVETETSRWVYPITVSIGISNYPVDGDCIEDIILKAEQANIYAKNSGKNKVVKWELAVGGSYSNP
jgi:diguanylate cyclase (GGDEF)-like protein